MLAGLQRTATTILGLRQWRKINHRAIMTYVLKKKEVLKNRVETKEILNCYEKKAEIYLLSSAIELRNMDENRLAFQILMDYLNNSSESNTLNFRQEISTQMDYCVSYNLI